MYVAKKANKQLNNSLFVTGTSKELYDVLLALPNNNWRTRSAIVAVMPTGDEVRSDPQDGGWSMYTTVTEDVSHVDGAIVYKERRTKSRAMPMYSFGNYLDECLLEETVSGPLRLVRRVYASGDEFFEVAATGRTRDAALAALNAALREADFSSMTNHLSGKSLRRTRNLPGFS